MLNPLHERGLSDMAGLTDFDLVEPGGVEPPTS